MTGIVNSVTGIDLINFIRIYRINLIKRLGTLYFEKVCGGGGMGVGGGGFVGR